jgi:hypothetical protein
MGELAGRRPPPVPLCERGTCKRVNLPFRSPDANEPGDTARGDTGDRTVIESVHLQDADL